MARPKQFKEAVALGQAMDIFWEKGYQGTSIQDLVGRIKINRASLYGTFGDKHQLYIKALRRYQELYGQDWINRLDSEAPLSELLSTFLDEVIEQGLTDKHRKGCFLVNATAELAGNDQAVREVVEGHQQALETQLIKRIRTAQQAGTFRSDQSPESMARFFINTVFGLRIMSQTHPKAETLKDIKALALLVLH